MLMTCNTLDEVVCELLHKVPITAPPVHRARIIYDWEIANIAYDHERNKAWFKKDILHPEETLARGQGICTDMSALYVAIARRMGLIAHYAHVDVDHEGRHVEHACAAVDLPGRRILVDPAYKIFDACHKEYYLVEPDVLEERTPCYGPPPRQHRHENNRLIALAGTILLFGAAYAITKGEPFVQRPKTNYEETSTGARFWTKNGEVTYTIDQAARTDWNESVLRTETAKKDLNDKELLDLYAKTDKNLDRNISAQEAQESLSRARKKDY